MEHREGERERCRMNFARWQKMARRSAAFLTEGTAWVCVKAFSVGSIRTDTRQLQDGPHAIGQIVNSLNVKPGRCTNTTRLGWIFPCIGHCRLSSRKRCNIVRTPHRQRDIVRLESRWNRDSCRKVWITGCFTFVLRNTQETFRERVRNTVRQPIRAWLLR